LRFLSTRSYEAWMTVRVDSQRWAKDVARKHLGPTVAFKEMRRTVRSLPYDSSMDAVNRHLARDAGGRQWTVFMAHLGGRWWLLAQPHNNNGGRERV